MGQITEENDPLAGLSQDEVQNLMLLTYLSPVLEQADADLRAIDFDKIRLRRQLRRPVWCRRLPRVRRRGARPRARRRSGARRASTARDDGEDGPGEPPSGASGREGLSR